jgi:hypothetical protein
MARAISSVGRALCSHRRGHWFESSIAHHRPNSPEWSLRSPGLLRRLRVNLNLSGYVSRWVERELTDYTGMINLESIGGRIIETQLRFADQWCDIYGRT